MSVVSYEKELICIGPDKAMRFLFAGLFSKDEALGFRVPSYEIDTHPLRDAGCLDADELLESQANRYRFAIIVANAERSGRKGEMREDVEARIEEKLASSGWESRARAIIVDPGIDRWLLEHSLGERWSPDIAVQSTLEAALRLKKIPQSPELYRDLGRRLVDEGESDPAWQKIIATLTKWFPSNSDPARDLFSRIETLSEARQFDTALDLVFDYVDDLLLSSRFSDVEHLLRHVPTNALDAAILVGFLTITGPAREALCGARPGFVARVRAELEGRMSQEEVSRVMKGLE